MFEIIVTVCLATGSPCADRLLPSFYKTETVCSEMLDDRTKTWLESHDDLELRDSRCILRDNLPAVVPPLRVQEIANGVFVHKGLHGIPSPLNKGDLANLGFVVGEKSVISSQNLRTVMIICNI